MLYITECFGGRKPSVEPYTTARKRSPRFPPGVAYLDTIHVWFSYLHDSERTLLERHGIMVVACRYGSTRSWRGWTARASRPTIAMLRALDTLQIRNGRQCGSITRLDIALDHGWASQAEADAAKAFIKRHSVLVRRRRTEEMQFFADNGGWAWKDYRRGHRPPAKNLVTYARKLDPYIQRILGTPYRSHVELRFMNGRACRAVGIYRVSDVLDINPADLFPEHIRLCTHKKARGPLQVFKDRYPRTKLTDISLLTLRIPCVLSLHKQHHHSNNFDRNPMYPRDISTSNTMHKVVHLSDKTSTYTPTSKPALTPTRIKLQKTSFPVSDSDSAFNPKTL
jgi:hypothetical protein